MLDSVFNFIFPSNWTKSNFWVVDRWRLTRNWTSHHWNLNLVYRVLYKTNRDTRWNRWIWICIGWFEHVSGDSCFSMIYNAICLNTCKMRCVVWYVSLMVQYRHTSVKVISIEHGKHLIRVSFFFFHVHSVNTKLPYEDIMN